MAIAKHSMSAIYATLAALFTATAAVALSAPLQAAPVYHLTLCGDLNPGSPCYVEQANVTPPPGSLDGIDEALAKFYAPLNPAGPLNYYVQGANNNGYVFGPVDDGLWIRTYFVYYQGEVICCTADTPFNIAGLNENNVFIVNPGTSTPQISFGPASIQDTTSWPPVDLDAESRALVEANLIPGFGDDWRWFFFENYFTAIDNDNRISGLSWMGAYLLTPVQVPDPGSIALLAAALAMAPLLRHRTQRG